MLRPSRFIIPGQMVEVTMRSIQSRDLLRPSRELNEVILAVLGRALHLYDVELHAFGSSGTGHMSWHLLVGPTRQNVSCERARPVNQRSALGRHADDRTDGQVDGKSTTCDGMSLVLLASHPDTAPTRGIRTRF